MDKIDSISACLTSSFGYLVYIILKGENKIITNLEVRSLADFISLSKSLLIGLPIGGFVLLSSIGICILPFVVVHEKFARLYDIPANLIYKVYCSMFLMTTSSISIVILASMYFIRRN